MRDEKWTLGIWSFCILILVGACSSGDGGLQSGVSRDAVGGAGSAKADQGNELLDRCIEAHGGMASWNGFEGLEYNLINNGTPIYQLTHLKDRRAFIRSEDYTVGYNGEVAWSIPNASKLPGKSAAFYYNLDFYFVGMPFVLKDPGVIVEDIGMQTVDGTPYACLQVSFGESVGLTPKDVYFLYIDPTTYLLKILVYSITYFEDTPPDKAFSSAKVYSGYQDVQGIKMPSQMENFVWKDGSLGESKHHLRLFEKYRFLKELEDQGRFEPPANAEKEDVE